MIIVEVVGVPTFIPLEWNYKVRTFETPRGYVRAIYRMCGGEEEIFLAVGEIDKAGCYQGEYLEYPRINSAIKIRMGEFSTR